MIAGTYCGTLTVPRLVFLGFVPPEFPGIKVRALYLVAGRTVLKSPNDYWSLKVGLWNGGSFETAQELALSDGLETRGKRLAFAVPMTRPAGRILV